MAVIPAIPASQIVSVAPSVLSAGGTAIDLTGLFLTQNTRVPLGQILSFPTSQSVSSYFGATSNEAALAAIYFLGFNNSNKKPGFCLFTQYNTTAVSAYLRGGSVSALSLSALQAVNGNLTLTINGTVTSGTINLATATGFSSAAQIIADTLDIVGPQVASVTGTISGTTLTVTSLSSGTLAIGQIIQGTSVIAGTYITAFMSGTGGTGTYAVSSSQNVGSETLNIFTPGVSYDSVSGAFVIVSNTTGTNSTINYASGTVATALLLTQSTGAVLSQGANALTPGTGAPLTFMNSVTAFTQNWAAFTTVFEAVSADKISFAQWTNSQNNRYLYAMWDTNIVNTQAGGPSNSVSTIISDNYSGTALLYSNPAVDLIGGEVAAFLLGAIASIDYTETNGRSTMAFKAQTGLAPQVTNVVISQYLQQYGLSYYGDWTSANSQFTFLYPGNITGPFLWIDSYVNQIWLNNQLQIALMSLLTSAKSVPYNTLGYGLIEAACMDPILTAVNFGSIVPGVPLSASQVAQVNAAAGYAIDQTITQRGWYLQVLPASAQVRQARQSPPITLFYADGESIQSISIASIDIL